MRVLKIKEYLQLVAKRHDHNMTPRVVKWNKREIPGKGIPSRDIIERNGKKYRIVLMD